MKFLALVSGGKDSCMNILHCVQQGHELVALVNLHPKPCGSEEIDSYMFQTVGSRAIENLAECLDKPLYRDIISDNEEDVVETLVGIFSRVISDFPDIKAVSVGAIGSVYQQLRVDTACQRVGLESLTFLWQRDQIELLDEIIASGLDARIIKVAGIGLDESHLGKSLAECRPHLLKLNKMYGLHPCGEGGEYETMVFDGPIFKKSLVMMNSRVVEHASDDVFYLSFHTMTQPKEGNTMDFCLPVPPVLSDPFDSIDAQVSEPVHINPRRWCVTPWQAEKISNDTFQLTVAGDIEHVFAVLESFYAEHEFTLAHTRHVSVILSDMQQFASMNKRYVQYFNILNPPSRLCIEVPIQFEAEITVFGSKLLDGSSKCLHVQGRSFWAPANIGPYSQARLDFGLNYVAGQIGLLPASLTLESDLVKQALLALQNAYRVVSTIHGGGNWDILSATVFITNQAYHSLVQEIWQQTEFASVPLLVAEVCQLPRGAVVEWALQTFDTNLFEYQSTIDENDDFVWPARRKNVAEGFELQFGLYTFRQAPTARAPASSKYATIYTKNPGSLPDFQGQVIPVLNLWISRLPRDTVVQSLA